MDAEPSSLTIAAAGYTVNVEGADDVHPGFANRITCGRLALVNDDSAAYNTRLNLDNDLHSAS
jgi:hypothetical protein